MHFEYPNNWINAYTACHTPAALPAGKHLEMGKNPHCLGSVLFGSKMSVFLHCKIAYSTEENVCFALLNRIVYWNHVMSTLLQSSPLILHKSCLPVHATYITSNVTLNYQLEQTTHSKLEMGKNPHCSGSVLFGFGSTPISKSVVPGMTAKRRCFEFSAASTEQLLLITRVLVCNRTFIIHL